jgi:tetratricopeptide (TPR) repeat protein
VRLILHWRGIAVDSTVIQATIAAVSAVIVALIGVLVAIYQRTGKLFPISIKLPFRNHDSPSSVVYDLIERGSGSYDQGQYPSALNYYQRALVIHREVGNRAMEGTTLNNTGLVYQARGQYDQALENFQRALVIAREVGYKELEEAVLASIKSLSDE